MAGCALGRALFVWVRRQLFYKPARNKLQPLPAWDFNFLSPWEGSWTLKNDNLATDTKNMNKAFPNGINARD